MVVETHWGWEVRERAWIYVLLSSRQASWASIFTVSFCLLAIPNGMQNLNSLNGMENQAPYSGGIDS